MSEEQFVFPQGRNIYNNIFISNELAHNMANWKSKHGIWQRDHFFIVYFHNTTFL